MKIILSLISFLLFSNLVMANEKKQHEIKVLDIVTKKPIKDVEIRFTLSSSCETIFYESESEYDYETCNGRYKKIENKITNENGIISFWTIPGIDHPYDFGYVIVKADGYAKNASYGILFHKIVWLVPNTAPISSRKEAVEYTSKEKPVREIIDFYTSHDMRVDYSSLNSEWANYGVLSASFNVSRPFNENLRMSHGSVGILVHPATRKYFICNYPWKNRNSPELSLHRLRKGQESEFFKQLERRYSDVFTQKDCNSDLLIKSDYKS